MEMTQYKAKFLKEEEDKNLQNFLDDVESGEASSEMVLLHDESLSPEVFTVQELREALKNVPDEACIYLKTATGENEKVLRIEMSASYQIQITTTMESPTELKKETGVIEDKKENE
jgi:hypothetical protein